MKELRRKLLTHARSEAKRRLYDLKKIITKICSTLYRVLSPDDYENIMRVTDASKDPEYQKSKRQFKEKFKHLNNKTKSAHIQFRITNVQQ